ncbi:MAG: THAP domain-containing protein [Sphingomonadales bacterium]|nr:THAP domain-containing protein [Sphingomonadales bacterium]
MESIFIFSEKKDLLKRWLVKINMKCLRTAGDRICQDHFDPDDIVERTSCIP